MRSVSVIIPSYNYGSFIKEAIDSALAQTYRPLEVIVVDDGSTDGTADIAQHYSDRDPRVRLVERGRNRGKVGSFNEAFTASRGETIVLLAGDDRLVDRGLHRRGHAVAHLVERAHDLVREPELGERLFGRSGGGGGVRFVGHGNIDHRKAIMRSDHSERSPK